jgi:hypothetical protein
MDIDTSPQAALTKFRGPYIWPSALAAVLHVRKEIIAPFQAAQPALAQKAEGVWRKETWDCYLRRAGDALKMKLLQQKAECLQHSMAHT